MKEVTKISRTLKAVSPIKLKVPPQIVTTAFEVGNLVYVPQEEGYLVGVIEEVSEGCGVEECCPTEYEISGSDDSFFTDEVHLVDSSFLEMLQREAKKKNGVKEIKEKKMDVEYRKFLVDLSKVMSE